MFGYNLFLVLILSAFYSHVCVQCQHVYDSPCSYNMSTKTFIFNRNTIKISGKRSYEVYVNLCGPVNVKGCDPKAFACILNKKNPKRNVKNAGRNFEIIEDDEAMALKSKESAVCDDGYYQLFIHLDSAKVGSVIQEIDDCEMHIRILNPNANINSITNEKGYLINMEPLKNLREIIFPVDEKKFAFSFWKPSVSCSSETVSGCEIINEQKNVISLLKRQHVVYNSETNIITIRSNNGAAKSNKIVSDIIVKCNWDVDFANPVKLMARYKFQIDSKYGCVKLPMNCSKIVDDHHFTYNLSELNRPEGWNVATPSGSSGQKILLNVCGPLKMAGKNHCSVTQSQMCEGNISHGSTYTPIQEWSDSLHLDLNDGSVCPTNNTKRINTHVKFICASLEKGPVLTSQVNCTNEITWETPQACPSLPANTYKPQASVFPTTSCSFIKNGRKYDLSQLSKTNGHYTVNYQNYEYSINVCAPIKLNNQNVLCGITGGCLHNIREPNIKKRYFSFGLHGNPIIEDNKIVLKYKGGICKLAIRREIIIHLYCSMAEKNLQLLNRSDCVHEFSWYTKHACPQIVQTQRSASDCQLSYGKYEIIWHRTIKEFNVKLHNNSYKFNLCNGIYKFQSANPEETEIEKSSELNLIVDDCKSYLQYEMKNESCENSFKNLKIQLECNNEESEVVYEQSHIGNCSITLIMKSSDVCNLQNEYSCNKEMNQGYKIETPIKSTESVTYIATEQTKLECNTEFSLQDIPPTKVYSSNRTLYSIGYGVAGCDDLLCKNNITIAGLNRLCPVINIDHQNLHIQFTVVGDLAECGQSCFFMANIIYTCSSDISIPVVIEEKTCSVTVTIPGSKFCSTFDLHKDATNSSNKGLIIFGICTLILAIIILILVFLYRFKNGGYSRICPERNKSRTFVYTRNAAL